STEILMCSRVSTDLRPPFGSSPRQRKSMPIAALLVFILGTSLALPRAGLCRWQSWQIRDGLASNLVTSILEDRSGVLWFGTDGGVSRYDGVSWRTFTTTDGLADDLVSSMLEDRSGALWFGTPRGGVSRDG